MNHREENESRPVSVTSSRG